MVLTERESTERTALIGVATCGAGLLLIIVSVIFSNSLVQVADLFNSFLQFVSIGLSWLTLRALRKDNRWTLYLDPLASGITVGFMIQSAWKLTRHSIHDLLDRSLEEPLQDPDQPAVGRVFRPVHGAGRRPLPVLRPERVHRNLPGLRSPAFAG